MLLGVFYEVNAAEFEWGVNVCVFGHTFAEVDDNLHVVCVVWVRVYVYV